MHGKYSNFHKKSVLLTAAIVINGTLIGSTYSIYKNHFVESNTFIVEADNHMKEYKWTKKAFEEGTTIDATYLWPDETNPNITSIYRDGTLLSETKMITITTGSMYHFRGISDESILYTEVYVGSISELDITSGESGTWYKLLPSVIRKKFEEEGWTWQTGWEYTGRAYLDIDNKRVMIKADDSTAVLYGVGLYLDNAYNYSNDKAFEQERDAFVNTFESSENLFASALEYYYTKSGELRSTCPKIYALVADTMSELDNETAQIRNNTVTSEELEQESEVDTVTDPKNETSVQQSILMTELLTYVNEQRTQNGLESVGWDDANEKNILIRLGELKEVFLQTRPDGTDAFSAYTNDVKCEIRMTDTNAVADIYDSASNYFLKPDLISFNCVIDENITVLIFTW